MNAIFLLLTLVSGNVLFSSCTQQNSDNKPEKMGEKSTTEKINTMNTAIFGAGCFWCVEAQFQMLDGVESVISGFTGGTVKNPSYKEVCSGTTGHAEVCLITYDSSKISYDELLAVFWKTHDPTQLNRQGNDMGTQYRSAIFYQTEKEKELAEFYKKELNASGAFAEPIVTEISPLTVFYKAEDYHQNYFNQHGNESYCQFVIQPKVEKLKKVFKDKLKN